MAETQTKSCIRLTLTPESLKEKSSVFVHSALKVAVDSIKGRKVVSTRLIKDGEVLLIDSPYALVPAMMADDPPFHLCSRHECNRRIQPQTELAVCPAGCADEVVWCNAQCRQNDKRRHEMECSWLKRFASDIRARHGDSTFGILWLIARIILRKHLEQASVTGSSGANNDKESSHFYRRGWDSIWNLEGSESGFPVQTVEKWKNLAQSYLVGHIPSVNINIQDVVDLYCKLETNSFGLYPGVTGEYPVESFVSRGDYYGAGIYPTAAMFNHSCCPNVIHKLDEDGNRIFEANRDIALDEECCISYFDLVEYSDTKARQEEMERNWNFMCSCQRCNDEGDFEMPHFLKEMDF